MRSPYTIAAISVVLALAGPRQASAQPQAGEVLALSGQCSGEIGGGRKLLKLAMQSMSERPSKWRPVRS